MTLLSKESVLFFLNPSNAGVSKKNLHLKYEGKFNKYLSYGFLYLGYCYELNPKFPNNIKEALKSYKEAFYFLNKTPNKPSIFSELTSIITIEKKAMPLSHSIGSRMLTEYGNILFQTKSHDYHCGLRGFNKEKISKLKLECTGMDFASEIILKCQKANYKIVEIPTKLFKDGRGHKSHLNTIRDGMKHVKCLIKYRYNR